MKEKKWEDPLDTHPLADVLFEVTYARMGEKAGTRRWALEQIEKYYADKYKRRKK